jgi:hypothetical protein
LLHHPKETLIVKEMRAGRDVSLQPAGVDVLQADRAVVVGSVRNTFVGFISRETQPTGVTVGEFVTATSPANTTPITVELSLVHIIIKLADSTEIFTTKHSSTVRGGAQVRDCLSCRTHKTYNLSHRTPVKTVIGGCLIMTESAIVSCITTRPN